jgi:hypothetical protein
MTARLRIDRRDGRRGFFNERRPSVECEVVRQRGGGGRDNTAWPTARDAVQQYIYGPYDWE